MTVSKLKETMSYQEFLEWQDYYNEEPFLADRLEAQLAKIGHTNLFTGMNKIDIDYDYFLVSHFDKQNKEVANSDYSGLADKVKAAFGVK